MGLDGLLNDIPQFTLPKFEVVFDKAEERIVMGTKGGKGQILN